MKGITMNEPCEHDWQYQETIEYDDGDLYAVYICANCDAEQELFVTNNWGN